VFGAVVVGCLASLGAVSAGHVPLSTALVIALVVSLVIAGILFATLVWAFGS
jgi:hypothetical protein